MRVAFAGTPEFAAAVLGGLLNSSHDVGLVISQPNPRRGRGRKTAPTPVAELAHYNELPLVQPSRIGEVVEEISRHDALVVAAYGQILRADTLYAARFGSWNVHASLLPRYRGAAPVERAIIDGAEQTGVTIMQMDEGLDTGPIGLQKSTPIPPDMTGGELTGILADQGSKAIVEALDLLAESRLTLSEQDNLLATYAAKLSDEDKVVGWDRAAEAVKDLVRALAPRIGARTFHPEVKGVVKIWSTDLARDVEGGPEPGRIRTFDGRLLVDCGIGVLEVLELQMPGGRRVGARDFLRGNALAGSFLA